MGMEKLHPSKEQPGAILINYLGPPKHRIIFWTYIPNNYFTDPSKNLQEDVHQSKCVDELAGLNVVDSHCEVLWSS